MKRPTSIWRENVAREASELATGVLSPDDAYAAQLWPEGMCAETDEVIDGFEADIAELVNHRSHSAADQEIFDVIERTVKALNAVNLRYDEDAYATGEREQLCEYIESQLEDAGIDVDAFAERHGLTRHEITDEWRNW